ncbi:RidA family protein [uncultured Nisaea sp.]|uniref:RidA family protein n=1 Tax=uncultured Nisaea sp. TaxID=538215 RepID=UPI0030EE5D2E|tara:strand:- start:756 stop:1181 length:426 start_codon:yes stop_codon:yes gene_type:complete
MTGPIRISPPEVWSDDDFPFSQAVVEPLGRRVHLTGQVSWNADGEIVGPGDPKVQTGVAIDNIEIVLSALGGQLSDIVSTTLYYVRDEDLPAIQNVRMRRFPKAHGPATTGVKVAGLVDPGLLVELAVIAVIPEERFQAPA